jgi:hypothetical protein
MRVFLDFEASSLADESYPIEVGWVFEDGREESHLIRPAPGWDDWDFTAEAIHRIGRQRLVAEGEAHDAVARRILSELATHTVYVSAPSWDGKWLSVLLRAGGFPRHAMRLRDSDEAMMQAARSGLAATLAPQALDAAAADLVERCRRAAAARPIAHRALADAMAERALWLEVGQKAAELSHARGRE